MDTNDGTTSIPASEASQIDSLLDNLLPPVAMAAERGLLTNSQIHKLHCFIETVRNAPAYENAYPPISRVLKGPMSPQSQSFLCWLPNELVVEIICALAVEDILSLRMTCKRLHPLTRLRYVWHSALHRHVVDRGLPVPSPRSICGVRYRLASSSDLEARTVHATRLHANLLSDSPQIIRAVQLHTGAPPPDSDAERIPQILTSVKHIAFFDTSHGQRYLFAAFGMDCLGCWEISPGSGSIFHVAQWQSSAPISRVLTNEHAVYLDHDSVQGVVAVASRTPPGTKVTILALDTFRGRFTEIGSVMNSNSSSLQAFRGFLLAFVDDNRVIHWRDSFTCRVQSEPWIDEDWNTTLSMTFIDNNSILLLRQNTVELFLFPTVQAPLTQTSINPVASYTFPFFAYEATLTGYYPQAHGAPMSVSGQTLRHPISVLLRAHEDGDDNVHHFVFDLEPRQLDGSLPSRPIRFPPTHARKIPVSPSCSRLYLNPSGRGYWLETRNVGSKRRSYPARCVIGLCITSTSTRGVAPDLPETWQVDLKVGTTPLYHRQCGLKDLKEGRHRISIVAMDDSVGRVAVGDIDGAIVVLDYA